MPIDRRSMQEIRALRRLLGHTVPTYVFRALAAGLYEEGLAYRKQFRAAVAQVFKTKGQKVGQFINVYTAGDTFSTLRLGIFTTWDAAEIYEFGGTIVPRGRWLMIPMTPEAYSNQGKMKNNWRLFMREKRYKNPDAKIPGTSARMGDLFPVKVRGGLLLCLDVTGTEKTKRGFRTRQFASGGSRIRNRSRHAVWPVFLLTRATRRNPILNFFGGFEARTGLRGQALQRKIGSAIRAAARQPLTT